MKRVIAGAVAFGFALLLASLASAQDAAKIAKGEQLYTAQKCALCHSIADKGNKKGPLDGVGTKLKTEEIKEWLVDPKAATAKAKADRKPPMKAYNTLPAADIDALVAYMQSLKK
jgi:mono/diheme cytochrome c family protein